MSGFDLFILIFYALDHYWDKHGGAELGNFLSGMNPFLFLGEGSAVPDVYDKYEKFLSGRDVTLENSYQIACEYIGYLGEEYISDAFSWVEKDKWNEKCKKYLSEKA